MIEIAGAVVAWLVVLAAMRCRAILAHAIAWWDAPRDVGTFRDVHGRDRSFTGEEIARSPLLRELAERADRIAR